MWSGLPACNKQAEDSLKGTLSHEALSQHQQHSSNKMKRNKVKPHLSSNQAPGILIQAAKIKINK
jgi:hypothetical protein